MGDVRLMTLNPYESKRKEMLCRQFNQKMERTGLDVSQLEFNLLLSSPGKKNLDFFSVGSRPLNKHEIAQQILAQIDVELIVGFIVRRHDLHPVSSPFHF